MSILDLLKQNAMPMLLNSQAEQLRKSDGGMHNPDIPGDMAGTEKDMKSNAYDKVKGEKNYLLYQNQRFDKLRGKKLNGDFLRLPYKTNYGGKSYNQQLEGAVDADNLIRKINPLRASPYDYIEGAEGLNFRDLPSSVYYSHNSTELLAKARSSYASRVVALGQLPSFQINHVMLPNKTNY